MGSALVDCGSAARYHKSCMLAHLHITVGRLWRLGRAAFLALLFVHVFVGPSAFAALTAAGDACGDGPCPCESLSEEVELEPDGDPCAGPWSAPCPDEVPGDPGSDDDSDGPCPLSCEGCTCCPGVAVALASSPPMMSASTCPGTSMAPPADVHAPGFPERLFKPPRTPSD